MEYISRYNSTDKCKSAVEDIQLRQMVLSKDGFPAEYQPVR